MYCPRCGSPNVSGAKFCPECGTQLPASDAEVKISEEVRSQVERMAQAALAARDAGELYEAEAILRDALRLDPESAAAHSALSHVLQAQGDPAAAAAAMAEAARLDPARRPRNLWMNDLRRQAAALPKTHPAYIGLGVAIAGFLIAFFMVRHAYRQPDADAGGLTIAAAPASPSLQAAPLPIAPLRSQIAAVPPTSYPSAPPPVNWQGNSSDRAAVDTSAIGPGGTWISPTSAFGAGPRPAARLQTPQERARTAAAGGYAGSLPPLLGGRGNPGALPPVTTANGGYASGGATPHPVYGSAGGFNSSQNSYSNSQSNNGAGSSQPSAPGPGYITLSAPSDQSPNVSPTLPPSTPTPDFAGSRNRAQVDYTRGDYEKAASEYKQALRVSPSLLETARIRQELGMTYASMGAPREAEQEYTLSQEMYKSMLSGPNAELARQALSTIQKQRQLLEGGP